LVAYVYKLKEESVKARLLTCTSKELFVSPGSARSHHNTIEIMFRYILLYLPQPCIRACIQIVPGADYILKSGCVLRDLGDVYYSTDIGSAMTNKYSDPQIAH
jgi:hypothetical protein